MIDDWRFLIVEVQAIFFRGDVDWLESRRLRCDGLSGIGSRVLDHADCVNFYFLLGDACVQICSSASSFYFA